MLTVYLVLLFAVPSTAQIGVLGSLGRPSLLWGLLLLFWWVLTCLQRRSHVGLNVRQPVRVFYFAFVAVVLVSFAAALLRGQPVDQISPAVTAVLRLASAGGVLLVAMDGIRSHDDAVRLVRRLCIAGGALAALGLLQSATGRSFLDWWASVPGIVVEAGGISARGEFVRASATAIHALEYGTVIAAILPLAVVTAISRGYRRGGRSTLLWWLPVGLIAIACVVAVSRSTIIGLVVAAVATLPAIPRAVRAIVVIGGMVAVGVVVVVIPRMLTTLIGLFAGASDDPSTQSRADALARVPDFIASSPLIGQGFGTFLPRYYIFDNAWVLLIVETGLLGLIAFAGMTVAAMASAVWAASRSPFTDTKQVSWALAASILTIAVLLLFFDGLSFPMSAGLFILLVGLATSVRTIAAADVHLVAATARASRPEDALQR